MGFIEHSGVSVISGGQTGVDLAGLRAAQCLGFRTGGWAPLGYKTALGPKPQLEKIFKLKEHGGGYASRTRKNVDASSVTIIVAANPDSAGTKLTIDTCIEFGVPFRLVKLEPNVQAETGPHLRYKVPGLEVQREILDWLQVEGEKGLSEYGLFTINVAGNSTGSAPGIFAPAFLFFTSLFGRYYIEGSKRLNETPDQALIALSKRLFDPNIATALTDSYDYYKDLDPRSGTSLLITDSVYTVAQE